MTTFRMLQSLPLSLLLSACFVPAASYGTGADGSTSAGTTGEVLSTGPSPETSSTGGTVGPVDEGSGESGGDPPTDSTSSSTGSGTPQSESSSTSGDGTTSGGDGSSSSGEAVDTHRTVFLLPYAGAPMSFAGTVGADGLCQEAADAAGLEGAYLAWISAGSVDEVADRFTVDGGPFVLTDGTEIAADWADLTDGTLAAPILVDAQGVAYPPGGVPERHVITHTNADGTSAPGVTPCSGFNGDSAIEARWGDAGATDENWTQTGDGWACGNAISGGPSLYCFQQ